MFFRFLYGRPTHHLIHNVFVELVLENIFFVVYAILIMCSKLRPSMMQHLLRRLVFDVPLLNEHVKMPLKVRNIFIMSVLCPSLSVFQVFHRIGTVHYTFSKIVSFTIPSTMYTFYTFLLSPQHEIVIMFDGNKRRRTLLIFYTLSPSTLQHFNKICFVQFCCLEFNKFFFLDLLEMG